MHIIIIIIRKQCANFQKLAYVAFNKATNGQTDIKHEQGGGEGGELAECRRSVAVEDQSQKVSPPPSQLALVQ